MIERDYAAAGSVPFGHFRTRTKGHRSMPPRAYLSRALERSPATNHRNVKMPVQSARQNRKRKTPDDGIPVLGRINILIPGNVSIVAAILLFF